ncbi:hypothetical protein OKHIF_36320 [Mycobacteroides chelonae]|jgi:hypothetical protein
MALRWKNIHPATKGACIMVLIPNFESQSHFFTPVALAVNEQQPSSIVDQRFVFQTNGVAIVNMPGQTSVDWSRNQALISPNMSDAFKAITTRHNIPIPAGAFPWFQVDSVIPFATLSSIFDRHQAIDAGFAVDRWRFRTRTGIGVQPGQTIQSLFDGLLVDLAVRDSDAVLHRISYHITVQGRIRFVTGLT